MPMKIKEKVIDMPQFYSIRYSKFTDNQVVVDWWNTLHQPASISKFSSPNIDPSMMLPLFLMVFSFLFFYILSPIKN